MKKIVCLFCARARANTFRVRDVLQSQPINVLIIGLTRDPFAYEFIYSTQHNNRVAFGKLLWPINQRRVVDGYAFARSHAKEDKWHVNIFFFAQKRYLFFGEFESQTTYVRVNVLPATYDSSGASHSTHREPNEKQIIIINELFTYFVGLTRRGVVRVAMRKENRTPPPLRFSQSLNK